MIEQNQCLDRALNRTPEVQYFYDTHPDFVGLTEEEKEKPYAKFFYRAPAVPDDDVLKAVQPGQPMDPSKALLPGHMTDILKPGYLEVENGYCLLPGGGGYAAVCTRFPGITFEMYDWWRLWWGKEDLRYKLWYPGMHFRFKFTGAGEWILEDVGAGPINICVIHKNGPEVLEFGPERWKEGRLLTTHGGSSLATKFNCSYHENPTAMTNIHFVRETEDGFEVRSRFYLGFLGTPQGLRRIAKEGEVTLDEAYNIANHCAYEMANLRDLLPPLYAEMAGTP